MMLIAEMMTMMGGGGNDDYGVYNENIHSENWNKLMQVLLFFSHHHIKSS